MAKVILGYNITGPGGSVS